MKKEPSSQSAVEGGKIRDADALREARYGWLFPFVAATIAFAAKGVFAGASSLPVVIVSVIMFAPPIVLILGLIHNIGAWRNHSTREGLTVHAILGSAAGVLASLYLVRLFFF